MSSPTTALQGEIMVDPSSFSVILATHPAVDDESSPENSLLLTPTPFQVPAGCGLTVGRAAEGAMDPHHHHIALDQGHVGTIAMGTVPHRVLSLTPVQLPGGVVAVAASLSASNPDYWSITYAGIRTGPGVWHRQYHGEEVTIWRRDSDRGDWERFLRAQILNRALERPESGSEGSGTLLPEKARLERASRMMAGHLRRDLFGPDVRFWEPRALVIAATAYLVLANRTENLQYRLNATLDYAASGEAPLPEAGNGAAAARNTQFLKPDYAFSVLRVRYKNLAPAALTGYTFERLFGIESPGKSGHDARRRFYRQLWDAQIITRNELNAVAPFVDVEAQP